MREDWASYLNYQDYKRLGTSFESFAAFTEPTMNLIGDGEPERIRGAFAEAALFDVLGVAPAAGQLFTRDQETAGKENVVVIGWGLSQRRFGGPDAIGLYARLRRATDDGHRRDASRVCVSGKDHRVLGAARRVRGSEAAACGVLPADGGSMEASGDAGWPPRRR